jgi:hypothetical protein
MEPQKVKCSAEGCDHMILPATAVRTGGLCMRCVGKRESEKRQEFIRQNRRQVDPYAGLADPVDLIVALHTRRKYDPLITYRRPPKPIEALYGSLSALQAQRLAQIALDTTDADFAKSIARSLATLTAHDITSLQAAWVETGEFSPAVIFRRAPADVRDAIIAFLERWDGNAKERLKINDALCALAWIGDCVVQEKFAQWVKQSLPWRPTLHVGPDRYAHIAGWELTAQRRRDLFHGSCWSIRTAEPTDVADTAVRTFEPGQGTCPWCHRPLVTLIELDLRDARLAPFMPAGPALPVLTCEVCTLFAEHVFARVDRDGKAAWHKGNSQPKTLPNENTLYGPSPWRDHRCRLVSRPAMLAVEDGGGVDPSQIGGMPTWVQDTAYPTCPDCGQTMIFIAQLDNARFRGHEGIHYAFLCAPCRVTATAYQQT